MNSRRLPPEVEEKIAQSYRNGVMLAVDRETREVTEIRWIRHFHPERPPADPNALAEAILKHVTSDELPLEIDGHKYLIRKTSE